jgi:hypothetical protein
LQSQAPSGRGGQLDERRLDRCRALLVPNAAHLAPETMARIERWLPEAGDA